MRFCFARFAPILFVLLVPTLRAVDLTAVHYVVSFPEAANHYVEVEATIPTDGQATPEVFMPVWTPGSYLVREYARNIDRVSAEDVSGARLPIEKVSKNRWRIAAGSRDTVRLRYRVYAREINVRGNWVEPGFALLNGAPTFLAPAHEPQRSYEVSFVLPAGWQTVQTPLAPTENPTRFTAPDFDTLIDSPMVAGSPEVTRFDVSGVPFYLVTVAGDGVWANDRVIPSLKRMVEAQRDFWGSLASPKPYYFFNVLSGQRGGLEHKNSATLMAERWLSRTPGGVDSWLSLASHEFFHAWNGKRLRPAALGPFDYEHEVYTPSLWVVEGITSYYQHLLLQRAGVTSPETVVSALGNLLAAYESSPGRRLQSLGESSFDAWIKAYRPDENSTNTTISYYSVGALAGFLLDAQIRAVSHGQHSLDDAMRLAYQRYSGPRGYTEKEFIAVLSEVAGADLSSWFERTINQPGEFDITTALDWFGLTLKPAPAPAPNAPPPSGWLGADTKDDGGRLIVTRVKSDTPAYAAGLTPDDEILAIDNYRVSAGQLSARLNVYQAGAKITLLIARLDELHRLNVVLGVEPVPPKLMIRADSTPVQKAHREAWLSPSASPAGAPQQTVNPPATDS
ncbi:PDZ domain-containing protein [Horticoccus luteus]|uniref:PDZ domain-containing protein n=1 Tax=Horticoccus luteus TaxID=2862869 RepID=A0A8F9TT39_9BACT|nr:PDZ domain-containing protein [Horticoccus luteus]QYM77630.1 PDZ domain-containing protein [Horticoccus luteus]